MKKILVSLLCLLLASLCACGKAKPMDEKTTGHTTREAYRDNSTVDVTTISGAASQKPKASQSTVEIKTSEEDPYFSFAKRHKEAIRNDPNVNPYSYFLYDLDGNGKEELLIGLEGWGLYDVYIIQNGVAVRQEALFLDPAMDSPPVLYKNGTIRNDSIGVGGDGIEYISYLRFESGELKLQTALTFDKYNEGEEKYFQRFPGQGKDIPITKEEFDRLKKEMEGDGQLVELDWKPLAEYGR